MLGNTKPKGGKPQAPPPPPMKPQNIDQNDLSRDFGEPIKFDGEINAESLAKVFGVPPHLLAQCEQGSLCQIAFEELEQAVIRQMARHLNELALYHKKKIK